MTKEEEELFLNQFKTEFKTSEDSLSSRTDVSRRRLKLYNNQRKDDSAIGDNTLFSIMNTLLASIQADKLNVEFLGKEFGDNQTAGNINSMAEYDYEAMEKFDLDYEWNWNALFFGRTICLQREFDRDAKMPKPDLFDPLVTYIDPRSTKLKDSRFFGRIISITEREAKARGYEQIDKLQKSRDSQEFELAKQERMDAVGLQYDRDNVSGENRTFQVIEWYTYWQGKRTFFVVNLDKKTIHKEQELKQQDRWPASDRCLFPVAGNWYGVTIPDLVEDKQRAIANLKNIMYDAVELDTYPRFMYNTMKIPNESDLNVDFNRNIPIDGDIGGAIQAIQPRGLGASSTFMVDMLVNDANQASATPEVKQGAQFNKVKSASEIQAVTQGSEDRFGLIIKMVVRSDKNFWRQWYTLYKIHFKEDIDDKMIRLNGAYGTEWRKLTKDQIDLVYDPDIRVLSKIQSDNVKRTELNSLSFILSNPVEGVDTKEIVKEMVKRTGLSQQDVNRIFPPTTDERKAMEQNGLLSENKKVEALVSDDHEVYIRINSEAAETEAKRKKIAKHREFLRLQKEKPEVFAKPLPPEEQGQQDAQFQPTRPLNLQTDTSNKVTNE